MYVSAGKTPKRVRPLGGILERQTEMNHSKCPLLGSFDALLLLCFYSFAGCDQHHPNGGALVVQSRVCLFVYVISTI